MHHWKVFKALGLFVTEDLTPLEIDFRSKICSVMKSYWGLDKIPFSRF